MRNGIILFALTLNFLIPYNQWEGSFAFLHTQKYVKRISGCAVVMSSDIWHVYLYMGASK